MSGDCDEEIGEFLSLLGDEFEGALEPIEGDGYCFFSALVVGSSFEPMAIVHACFSFFVGSC